MLILQENGYQEKSKKPVGKIKIVFGTIMTYKKILLETNGSILIII